MLNKIAVYYNGWGEYWHWGTLVSSTAITGRPLIVFEYSEEAKKRKLELSSYTLPLNGAKLRKDFPAHQMGLPAPVYDALPDGWGMLLMDRLFKQRGLNPARIGPLERLTYIGNNAMGAMSFEPIASDLIALHDDISIDQLAQEVQEILHGEGGQFLQQLILMGGSPQGARPKALIYKDPITSSFSTVASSRSEAWLVKFPAKQEHPEVCAVEAAYAECLNQCGINAPEIAYFDLPNGQSAFASKRFDRQNNIRIPMQSLAAFTGADYQSPGTLDYANFLRATHLCTNDIREKAIAFERTVFNIIFNNRDDHPKNFSYLMSKDGSWKLAPAYDITFCEGPGGYHQMDVMGQALDIKYQNLLLLGKHETELNIQEIKMIVEKVCEVGSHFSAIAKDNYAGQITSGTLAYIQSRINQNISRLK